MMSYFLGIDTSNYTTSAALYSSEDHRMIHTKKLLPVKSGECGLRQSDAVFHHVQQLPEMTEQILGGFNGKISAIGVSSRPRDVEGSYMPCFTVGYYCGADFTDKAEVVKEEQFTLNEMLQMWEIANGACRSS